jgi:hypothetical protein
VGLINYDLRAFLSHSRRKNLLNRILIDLGLITLPADASYPTFRRGKRKMRGSPGGVLSDYTPLPSGFTPQPSTSSCQSCPKEIEALLFNDSEIRFRARSTDITVTMTL